MSAIHNPTTWREGFVKLSPTNPPCPGFRPEEWRAVYEQAKAFLETRGAEAAGKGWSGLDLFSVHEKAGAANVSALGALMIGIVPEPPGEITPEFLRLGHMRYFKPLHAQSRVLVWRFGA